MPLGFNNQIWHNTTTEIGLMEDLWLVAYEAPMHYPPAPGHDHLQGFHNHLVLQAGA